MNETMTPKEFTTWLQGFMDLHESTTISPWQWEAIKDRLKLVKTRTPKKAAPVTPNDDYWDDIIKKIREEPVRPYTAPSNPWTQPYFPTYPDTPIAPNQPSYPGYPYPQIIC